MMSKLSRLTKGQTKPSGSTGQIGSIPQSSAASLTPRIDPDQRSKLSAGIKGIDQSIRSMTPIKATSKPTVAAVTDASLQHAAIARSAIRQLILAGLVTVVLTEKGKQIRVCFDLDIWTQDLTLK